MKRYMIVDLYGEIFYPDNDGSTAAGGPIMYHDLEDAKCALVGLKNTYDDNPGFENVYLDLDKGTIIYDSNGYSGVTKIVRVIFDLERKEHE